MPGAGYGRSEVLRDGEITWGGSPAPSGTGDLDIAAATTGSDLDPDDYLVIVDDAMERGLGINQTIRISGLAAGDHTVGLDHVAPNCAVTTPNPRTVTISAGGVATTFDVRCT